MHVELKTLLAAALIAAFAGGALAAEHPRLYFSGDDLARLRATGFATPQYLDEAEFTLTYFGGKKVTFALPPEQPGKIEEPPGFDADHFGHYPYWTGMARAIQDRLEGLSLSYLTTGDERYARRAIEYALALSRWQVWTDLDYSKRTCLDTGHLTMGMAFAYDSCCDLMTEDERAAVRSAILRLGLYPLNEDAPERLEHNLQMLRNAALGIGACALLGETPRAPEFLDSARGFFTWWLDLRATSPQTEGLSYTAYGVDLCSLFALPLARVTGDESLLRHPYIQRDLLPWVLYFWGPRRSGLVNICDSGYSRGYDVTMRALSLRLADPQAGWYLEQSGLLAGKGFTSAILNDPDPPIASPAGWPTSRAFPTIGWAALRSGWGDDDTLLAFVSSATTMGHCHFDANAFVLNCAGEWLATDSGYGSHKGGVLPEYSRGTYGHNSLLVDGKGQTKKGFGQIASFFASPVFDCLEGDASGAYDPEQLTRFTRRIAYLKPDCFLLFDEIEAAEPHDFQWLLHTDAAGQYLIGAAGPPLGVPLPALDMAIVKPRARLQVGTLAPAGAQVTLTQYPGTEGEYPPYLSVSPPEQQQTARFLAVLRPVSHEASPGYRPLAASLDSVRASGGEVVPMPDYEAVLFKPAGVGEAIEFPLVVPAAGDYRLALRLLRSPAYGNVQAYLDGEPLGPEYRGYAEQVGFARMDLGAVHLDQGERTLRLVVTSKDTQSTGLLLGVQGVEIEPPDALRESLGWPPNPAFRLVEADGALGVEAETGSQRDVVLFRLHDADAIEADLPDAAVASDCATCCLRWADDVIAAGAALAVTRLDFDGEALLRASLPVDVAVRRADTDTLWVRCDQPTQLTLTVGPDARDVQAPDGVTASLADGVLELSLPAGDTTVTWREE